MLRYNIMISATRTTFLTCDVSNGFQSMHNYFSDLDLHRGIFMVWSDVCVMFTQQDPPGGALSV